MSIDTPVNPSDLVRVVGEEDAAWADTGTGVLLKVVRFDTQRGTWVILNRFKPGVQLQKHRHTGSVDAFTSAGRWHYLEYDFYVTPVPTSSSRPTRCTPCTCPRTTQWTPTCASSSRGRC